MAHALFGRGRVKPEEVDRQLVPTLRGGLAPGRAELAAWTLQLVEECRDLLGSVLPLSEVEIEFLTRLNDHGEVVPQLLTEDATEQRIIASHPGLLWKALNVRKHSGLSTDGQGDLASLETPFAFVLTGGRLAQIAKALRGGRVWGLDRCWSQMAPGIIF